MRRANDDDDNGIVTQKTRIKVCCRLRPVISEDSRLANVTRTSPELCVHLRRDGQSVKLSKDQFNTKLFRVDHTFNSSASQDEVYRSSFKSIVSEVVNGFNGTGMVYGQTGSGKTHTMFGAEDGGTPGLAQLAIRDIFDAVKAYHEKGLVANIFVSFYQVYMEQAYDLLSGPPRAAVNGAGSADGVKVPLLTLPGDQPIMAQAPALSIRSDPKRGTYLDGLQHVHVEDAESTVQVLHQGLRNRQVHSTQYNIRSSRSHAIFQLHLDFEEELDPQAQRRAFARQRAARRKQRRSRARVDQDSDTDDSTISSAEEGDVLQNAQGDGETAPHSTRESAAMRFSVRRRLLTLVDLAGSERVQSYHAKSKREMKEAVIINKSISALGNCIQALANSSLSAAAQLQQGLGGGSGSGVRGSGTTSAGSASLNSGASGGSQQHIPFRDCKLTRLLAEPLGGNSKTCVIVNIGPCAYNYEETNSTLKFALRAMAVRRSVRKGRLEHIRIKPEAEAEAGADGANGGKQGVSEADAAQLVQDWERSLSHQSGPPGARQGAGAGYQSAPESPTYLRHRNGFYVHPVHIPQPTDHPNQGQGGVPGQGASRYAQFKAMDPSSGTVRFDLGGFLRACQTSPHVVPPMGTLIVSGSAGTGRSGAGAGSGSPGGSIPMGQSYVGAPTPYTSSALTPSYGFLHFDSSFDPNAVFLSPVLPAQGTQSVESGSAPGPASCSPYPADFSRHYYHPAFSSRPAPATATATSTATESPPLSTSLAGISPPPPPPPLSYPTRNPQPVSYLANTFVGEAGEDVTSSFLDSHSHRHDRPDGREGREGSRPDPSRQQRGGRAPQSESRLPAPELVANPYVGVIVPDTSAPGGFRLIYPYAQQQQQLSSSARTPQDGPVIPAVSLGATGSAQSADDNDRVLLASLTPPPSAFSPIPPNPAYQQGQLGQQSQKPLVVDVGPEPEDHSKTPEPLEAPAPTPTPTPTHNSRRLQPGQSAVAPGQAHPAPPALGVEQIGMGTGLEFPAQRSFATPPQGPPPMPSAAHHHPSSCNTSSSNNSSKDHEHGDSARNPSIAGSGHHSGSEVPPRRRPQQGSVHRSLGLGRGAVQTVGPYGMPLRRSARTPSPLKTAKIMKEIRAFRWPTPEPSPEPSPAPTRSPSPGPSPARTLAAVATSSSEAQTEIRQSARPKQTVDATEGMRLDGTAEEKADGPQMSPTALALRQKLERKLDRRPSFVGSVVMALEMHEKPPAVGASPEKNLKPPHPDSLFEAIQVEAGTGDDTGDGGGGDTNGDGQRSVTGAAPEGSSRGGAGLLEPWAQVANAVSTPAREQQEQQALSRGGSAKQGSVEGVEVHEYGAAPPPSAPLATVGADQSGQRSTATTSATSAASGVDYSNRVDSSKALSAALDAETSLATAIIGHAFGQQQQQQNVLQEADQPGGAAPAAPTLATDGALQQSLLTLVHDLRSQLQKRDEEITTLRSFILKY